MKKQDSQIELYGGLIKEGVVIINMEKVIRQLVSHQLWLESRGEKGEQLNVDEVDFRDIDLTEYQFNDAYVTACTFDGMSLSGKKLASSLLGSSTFKYSNLENADFHKVNADYADFTSANIKNARFTKTDCCNTVFTKADLTNAKLIACSLYLTDFRDATLHNVDVSCSLFEDTLLKGAQLRDITGLEDASIISINIGTPDDAIFLEEEEAREWLIMNNLKNQ